MHKLLRNSFITLGAAMLAALTGCSMIKENIKEQVTYQIRSVDAQVTMRETQFGIPAPTVDIGISVEILNNSPINLTLNKISYTVFLDDKEMTRGETNEEVQVSANGGSNVIRFNTQLGTRELLNSGVSLTRNRGLPPIRVEGTGWITTRFGEHEVPFTLNYNESDEEA
ncbi:MAG: COG5608 family lipoprotein [Idiomarinaceae bacterium HL-53]|nr:MAG: COG5608 family lipoprotein [Idiomarinaceae bacterium HL-53]CUS49001.1 LEA14-like dessication related protein [Idiomarinaceae bacterium HL-53]